MANPTPSQLSAAANISLSYASMILSGNRAPSMPLALTIYRKTGMKLGPIASASEEDIDVLERVQGQAA